MSNAPKKHLSIAQHILSVDDLNLTPCPVPEWGLDTGLFIRQMNAAERAEWTDSVQHIVRGNIGGQGLKLHKQGIDLVILTLVDEEQKPVFPDKKEAETILAGKNGAVIDELVKKCLDANGLNPGDVEDEAKN